MRALLVNPWIYDFKAFDFWNKPIGLLIIAHMLKNYGFEIDFIDCMDRASPFFGTATKTDIFGRGKYHYEIVDKPPLFEKVPRHYKRYGIPRARFVQIINSREAPDIIFVTSSMTYWYQGVFEAIRILKDKFPSTRIILGGIYATLCEKHAMRNSGADIVFTGPLEKKLIALLSSLGYFDKPSADSIIMPDFSLYNTLHYGVVITSRGCPFHCSYCATDVLAPVYETLPNTSILKQLDYFAQKTKNIAFFDDALLYNKQLPDLLRAIVDRHYGLTFHTSNGLHCRYISQSIAQLMYEAHFKTMYLSLETVNPEVQKRTGGKVKTEEFTHAVNTLTKVGFSRNDIHTYLLFGMPGQSPDEVLEGISLCRTYHVHPHLCEFSPIPKTKEFEKTGFAEDTDPLYHNNLFYTWYYPEPKPQLYRRIKNFLSRKA